MEIEIKIDCTNAAFEGKQCGQEIARILRKTANEFEINEISYTLMDANGNKVGTCAVFE